MKEIPKAYNPKDVEDKIYHKWEESGYFNPDNLKLPKNGDYFSISMPPPNRTGTLHTGHATMLAYQDLMVRFNRLLGKKTLWLPGTDHAAIATQTKVESILYKEEKKTRHDLGKEKFLQKVREFAEESKKTINQQVRKMGSSCDWSRERYTLDEGLTQVVKYTFIKMYDAGLIERDYRIVNWCPRCNSTLSDDEVEYKEVNAKLYTFKYSKDFPFAIATTRPETKLGDTAVAVNPKDKRYKKYIGKTYTVDLGHGKQEIKIVTEDSVDPNFGTGALGVTPAHSIIDYEIAQKNNLPLIKVIGEDGKMTKEAGKNYQDLTVEEARDKFVKWLEKEGLMEKIEDTKQNLSICYRCDSAIEPLPSLQWFVRVNKKVTLAGNKYFQNKTIREVALQVVKERDIKIIPERFEKTYYQWLENLRDWCISRQIWFGHPIPVWYKDKGKKNEEIFVGLEAPKGDWVQDGDTLDTWFSSGLWTFSTLLDKNYKKYKTWEEWLKNSPDMQFHPTSVMETGYDILFFWIARMIIQTTFILGDIPFKTVYLHGLVRDEKGRKMSKSLGNVVDPLDLIEKFGTDALRVAMISGTAAGMDMRLYDEKVEGARNFVNKLWNISRYILSSVSEIKLVEEKPGPKTLADEWILARLEQVTAEITLDLENFNFSGASDALRNFTWSDLADWYLEISKLQRANSKLVENTENILLYILGKLLILWHPFIPFVTEEIWANFGCKDLLMVQSWPISKESEQKEKIEKEILYPFWKFEEIMMTIRNLRADFKVDPAKKVSVSIIGKNLDKIRFEEVKEVIIFLARLDKLEIEKSKPKNSVSHVLEGVGEICLHLEGLVDIKKEKERINSEIKSVSGFIKSLEQKLKNKDFVEKAPKEVVEKEEFKLKEQKEKMEKLEEQLKSLK
ncbi:valine--tRNA ligase [Candidatus Falkowbacteria bacterium]|nr:valine--tRNA ligase [Candidatus Falkowbacteria bacterium]